MITQLNKKQLKQFKNQAQQGRSMVEMLGVLAIIAILSIGGIIMFRYAMNYYQANQIAHEMNIMRTDAQIKIAQGTEKLTLGSPYNEHKINFNDYGTVFDCLDMETETSTPDKVVSCAVANAYYIELQEIPEGVCKPLANLIDNMDNEIAFYINGKSVDTEAEGEKGACDEGNNTLKVIFGADSNSNAIKCDTEDDCPTEQHICFNHMCVECEKDTDCRSTPDKPKCDTNTNTCKSCAEIDPKKPLWYNNKCVECITYNNCTDIEKPNCNSGTNTCERCPDTASRWDGEKCVGCNDNDDCPDGKYCDMDVEGCTNGEPYGKSRRCWVPQYTSYKINGKTYYKSKSFIDWWAAGRFCERVGEKEGKSLRRVSLTELGCDTSTCNNETDSLWKQLKDQGLNDWLWTSNEGTDCRAYIVDLEEETVLFYKKHVDGRNYETDALCVSDL